MSKESTNRAIAYLDRILANAELRRGRIDWLTNLVRNGKPLPDTPEGRAETALEYDRYEREHARLPRLTGSVEWDGIWRSGNKR